MHNQVFIFGYSGHSYVIIESLVNSGLRPAGYFDIIQQRKNPYGIPYIGYEKTVDIKTIIGHGVVFPTVGDTQVRRKLIEYFYLAKLSQISILDPAANVSHTAQIGISTYIGKNVIINAQSIVGDGVILNTGCIIEHECQILDYVHIAPGAVLCGNVRIGKGSFIGANAVIKENVAIGENVVVGAGATVVNNIIDPGVWIGNPAKKK